MTTALTGAFADPARDAAAAFRAALDAMARPGRITRLQGAAPPAPASPAAGALLLVLCDATTPLHLAGRHDCAALRDWITFHTAAPIAGRADCAFALGDAAALLPLSDYPLGTPDYPDRAVTLIAEVAQLAASGARLTGPGISGAAALWVPPALAVRPGTYPLGLDIFLTCGADCAGLPRTTRVEAG